MAQPRLSSPLMRRGSNTHKQKVSQTHAHTHTHLYAASANLHCVSYLHYVQRETTNLI